MSKYVIISDLHMSLKKGRIIDGLPESLYFPILNLRLAYEKAKELDCPLIIAGDINDAKRLIPQQVITEVLQILEEIGQDIDVYLILGNHDYELINGKVYTYLLNASNINIITPGNPLVLNGELGLVAYSYDRNQILEDIMSINPTDESIKGIVSHFGLLEGKLSGSEYRTGEFSLKRDFIGYNKWLILGHYHKPQEVTDKVIYVGSPQPISFSEYGEDKRFIVLDLENDSYESIPTIHPKWKFINVDENFNLDDIINDVINSDYLHRYVIKIPKSIGKDDIVSVIKEKQLENFIMTKIYDDTVKTNIQTDIKNIHEFDISKMFSLFLDNTDLNDEDKNLAFKLLQDALDMDKNI